MKPEAAQATPGAAASLPAGFWPACGWQHLQVLADGRLQPTPAWWAHWLARPELALVAESCPAETRLHQALLAEPLRPVAAAELDAVADDDVRQNYRLFLALRDGLQAAGTLEAFYLGLFRAGAIRLPPLFIDLIAQAMLCQMLAPSADAVQARAAELLFRPQRITLHQGRVLAGDQATVDRLSDAGGFGSLGRLLAEAQAPLRGAQLAVLGPDNQAEYWHDGERHRLALDLTHQVSKTLATGVQVPLTLAHSGQRALADVLVHWVQHLLGVAVRITPLARIDATDWRWHLGLDAESTRILNLLYQQQPVDDADLARLIGLYRLEFEDPADMRADLAGAPVWLGLAMDAEGGLRLKPQNLLLNLPLARLN